MKKIVIIFLVFFGTSTNAQIELKKTVKKDTIETEVVEIITSYTPKVTDAEKIKYTPDISLSRNVNKQKLTYNFKVKPVASTFIPKGVKMKVIKQEQKERIFNNYIKGGFGNIITPFLQAQLHDNSAYNFEYDFQIKGILSSDPIVNTSLNSTYFNSEIIASYLKEGNYLNYYIKGTFNHDGYNWYGLPNHIEYKKNVLSVLDQNTLQTYNNYEVETQINFDELYIEYLKCKANVFHDKHRSSEFSLNSKALFIYPLERYKKGLKDLQVGVNFNANSGSFKDNNDINKATGYQFATLGINPFYEYQFEKINTKIGLKTGISRDFLNNITKFLIYPDVNFNYIINKNTSSSIFLGATGDVKPRTYRELTQLNPYMSPNGNILPNETKWSLYGGFKGILSGKLNYNIGTNYINETNKPMFVLNKSKSDGQTTKNIIKNKLLRGYEYGNSFGFVNDNVKTLAINTEFEYVVDGKLNLGLAGTFNYYTMTKEKEAWNLPTIRVEFFTKYNNTKWFSGCNFYYVGNRKDVHHKNTIPETIDTKGYFSLNIDGGYHVNEYLTFFVKGTNLTNNSYEQFTNYNAQGILLIGGIIYKFDKLTKRRN